MEVYFSRADNLEESLRGLLERLRWEEIVRKDDKILIKPNFCTHELREGVTTNVQLLNSLAGILKERSENVFVGETYSAGKDYGELEKRCKLDCDFANLSEMEAFDFSGEHGTYKIPRILKESKIINVPVLKTHVLTGVTLGIKNLFGLVQDRNKSKYHFRINGVLSDLAAIQPHINILDATYGMDGDGPVDGKVHRTDFLLASRSVVALDLAACELIGVEPDSIEHLRLAAQRYGADYKIVGSSLKKLRFRVPRITKSVKLGALMQSNTLTRRIIEDQRVYPVAKKVKRFLDG